MHTVMYRFFFLLFVLGWMGCREHQTADTLESRRLSHWVNPFIGTGGHGHTYPGATMPFGMVQLSPDTRLTGWDGCSGYHYSDSLIYGFSHTHLQGTGVSDYGDILFMPTNNSVNDGSNWGERYRSSFRKETEKANAGYYSVHLDDHALTAELTATTRVGIHRYSFDKPDSCVLFIDMAHRDELLSYQFEPRGDTLIVGFRQSTAWATNQIVYFAASFSKPFEYLDQTYEIYYEVDPETGDTGTVYADVPVFPLKFGMTDTLIAKVALSSTSIEGALMNLAAEAPHWDFARYREDAEQAWDDELSAIAIETTSAEEMTTFYSALYHTLTVPNTWSDVNGDYRGTDGVNYAAEREGETQYTVFSLWDTFRAAHPLYTLIQQKRTGEFIRTMLRMHAQMGELPVWELAANETDCMIGYHSVSVIADAYIKGISDFDKELAFNAMEHTAYNDKLGRKPFWKLGYIPSEEDHESVSKTLEYAYDDWCIAQFAKAIGKHDSVANRYENRSLGYRNLYNPESKFIQPRRGGSFIDGFDPTEVNFNYTEANGWQYNFFAPHDINGHIELIGGDSAYAALLDEMFTTSAPVSGREQADITGLIGQYAHGNEPSHHMAYLYNFVGQGWKTQELVTRILNELYSPEPDGYSGNEDCGQMSAWYVLSALGFYPVTPGSDYYVLGTPRFNATLNLENGNQFHIRAKRKTPESIYIQSVTLNGTPYTRSYLTHFDVVKGGELVVELGPEPNRDWATGETQRPQVRVNDRNFVSTPIIEAARSFRDASTVRLYSSDSSASLVYRVVEDVRKTPEFSVYSGPFDVKTNCFIEAYAEKNGRQSATVRSEMRKIAHDWKVTVSPAFSNQYAAGGDQALIDGIKGGANFKTGEWQGYYGEDVVAIVDLGAVKSIKSVKVGAVQDIRPWIWAPAEVRIAYSKDGVNYSSEEVLSNPLAVDDYTPAVHRFKSRNGGMYRFVKITAVNAGSIPEWHLGAGNPRWIFLDEIEIEAY